MKRGWRLSQASQAPVGRAVRFALFFVLALGTILAGVLRLLEAAEVEYPPIGLNVIRTMHEVLPGVAKPSMFPLGQRVVLLGDSTLIRAPEERANVPQRLRERVADPGLAKPAVRVHSLATPGMGLFDYYFLSDSIVQTQPDQILLQVNLPAFSPERNRHFARPGLAGCIEPRHVPEALTLPLHAAGLTADRLFSYVGIVQLGGYPLWRYWVHEQARVGRGRRELAESLGDVLDSAERRLRAELSLTGKAGFWRIPFVRFNAAGERRHYGPVLQGLPAMNPPLRVLAAAARRFAGSGIRTLLFVSPTNVENMKLVGVYDPVQMRATLLTIQSVARQAGADFLDLHDLLPDAAFRDAAGHFDINPQVDAPDRLAEALAPWVVKQARAALAERMDAL